MIDEKIVTIKTKSSSPAGEPRSCWFNLQSRAGTWWGVHEGQPHTDVSLLLFHPPFSSLKINQLLKINKTKCSKNHDMNKTI